MNKLIKKWEYSTKEVMKSFLIKYFEVNGDELYKNDYFWVGNEIGGICCFGDYYINFSDMVYCLSNEVPINKFFEWYDWCLDTNEYINLDSFLIGGARIKEVEEKHLIELRIRVEEAERTLKEALKKYGTDSKE